MSWNSVLRIGAWDDLEAWPVTFRLSFAVVCSLAFSIVFRWIWPTEWMVDDGAIVLRYMDQFAQGGFFQYNLEEPPVFGISGFLHGVLAGSLARSGWFSSEASVLASNSIGVALTALALLLILHRLTRSFLQVMLGFAFTVACSHYYLRTAFQGLEAPLHLGFVLLAAWALLAGRRRSMWLLFAIAVISKLDAAAFVSVLGGLRLLELISSRATRSDWVAEIRAALIWAGIPLAVWVGFAFWVFGSPLPQTAYAKVAFHYHPPSRLGFFTEWWRVDGRRIAVLALVAFLGLALAIVRPSGTRARVWPRFQFLLGSAAMLALYCFYNPGERMPWYYVIPQTLLALACVAGFYEILNRLPGRWPWIRALIAIALFAQFFPGIAERSVQLARGQIRAVRNTEPERAAVGAYVYKHARPGDRLYTGHGYTAREARIFTYDYSGLNSPVVTDLRKEGKGPQETLRPEWTIRPSLMASAVQTMLGYELVASFYGISHDGRQAWRVYRLVDVEGASPILSRILTEDEIETEGEVEELRPELLHVRGRGSMRATLSSQEPLRALWTGVVRTDAPQTFEAIWDDADASTPPVRSQERWVVPARNPGDLVSGRTAELRIPQPDALAGASTVEIRLIEAEEGETARDFTLLEPVWVFGP